MQFKFYRGAFITALSTCTLIAVPAAAQQDFKIGVVASLSGGFAAGAREGIEGIQAWAKNRGLPGRKIVFETLDDETNPVASANAFRRLADDPNIRLMHLMVLSTSALSIKALASESKVPIISSGAIDALGRPADPYFFKVGPSSREFMTALIEYAKGKGYKKLAMLTATDAFGQADSQSLRELAPAAGIQIVAAEVFNNDDTNFNTQVAKIREANPDIIYDGATGRPTVLSVRQFKQLGITTPIVLNQAGISAALFQGLGGVEQANGLLSPTQRGSMRPTAGSPSEALYVELEKSLGRRPIFLNTFGYDVGLITETAVKNSDGSRQGIRDALEKLKDAPTLNGPVTFTPADHNGQDKRSISMAVLKDGVFVPAE